jgi:hypothetical protein
MHRIFQSREHRIFPLSSIKINSMYVRIPFPANKMYAITDLRRHPARGHPAWSMLVVTALGLGAD